MSVDDAGHTIPLPVHPATEEFPVVPPPGEEPGQPGEEPPAVEVAATEPGELDQAATSAWPAPAGARPPRRWPLALAWVLVGVLALSLGVLGWGYQQSLDSSRGWKALADSTTVALDRARADLDTTTATLTKTKSALVDTQKALDKTKGNLEAVAGQYNDASQRIRQLADEKAQVGDEAGLLATAVGQAARLQQQLDTCVTGLRGLQTYLVNAADYDPASLASFVAQVNSGCDEAQTQSAAFQQWLSGQ